VLELAKWMARRGWWGTIDGARENAFPAGGTTLQRLA
jgi:hypothetical protein